MQLRNKRKLGEEPELTDKEKLDKRLKELCSTYSANTLDYFRSLTVDNFQQKSMVSMVKLEDMPMYYLPPSFTRRKDTEGNTVIMFNNKNPLGPKKLKTLNAMIKATGLGSDEVYIHDDCALIVPRSYTDETGSYFDNCVTTTKPKPRLDELLLHVQKLLEGTTPTVPAMIRLVEKLRAVNKNSKDLEALLLALTLESPERTAVKCVMDLLSNNDIASGPQLAAAIIACMMSPVLLDELLEMGREGRITVDLLYAVLATEIVLPLSNFSTNQGLDSRGVPLRPVKLSSLNEDDNVVMNPKSTTKQAFKALTKDTLVYQVPDGGVYRKGPRMSGVDTTVELKVTAWPAKRVLSFAKASQGALGQRAAPKPVPAREPNNAVDMEKAKDCMLD
jgi:hypothetical protein